MRQLVGFFAIALAFAACSKKEELSGGPPPVNMRGVWQEAVSQSSSSGPQDPCNGFEVQNQTVSAFLLKIDEFGNVFDAKNVTDSQQMYRIIGTMNSEGKLTPNDLGRKEFLGNFADVQSGTFVPIIFSTYSLDPFKGELVTLDIDLQFIGQGGQTATQDWEKREYIKVTDAQEKLIIAAQKQCLAKTKGTP